MDTRMSFHAPSASTGGQDSNATPTTPPRVVIIGGGFGGLACAQALGRSEVVQLVTADAPRACRGLRDRALLEVFYACGLRVSEATGLRLTQLNLEAGWLTVVGKGRKERVVPLGQAARDALVAYLGRERPRVLRGRRSEFVFLGPRGTPLTRQAVWKVVKRRAAGAAVET